MKICQEHWASLREAIKQKGMDHLVSRGGHEAARRLLENANGDNPADNFDPLMSATMAIYGAAISDQGLAALTVKDMCPLCECGKQTAGLDADWIDGATDDQLDMARQLKLMPQVQ